MDGKRVSQIVNSREICDIYCNGRPVWIQEDLGNNNVRVGFADNFEEKIIPITQLKEKEDI